MEAVLGFEIVSFSVGALRLAVYRSEILKGAIKFYISIISFCAQRDVL
jgi:hypothetical protein